MKKIQVKRWLAAALLVLVGLVHATAPAHADSIVCPANVGFSPPISDNIPNSTACEIGGANNDSVSQVNADTMFNFSNWVEFSAINGSITGLGEFTGAATSGSINLSGVDWASFDNLMLVFKDGSGAPGNYVGYLMQVGYTGTVNWTTPFLNTNGSGTQPKDVSHIHAYVQGDGGGPPQQVPEPLSLILLGAGLGGIALARMRKRK